MTKICDSCQPEQHHVAYLDHDYRGADYGQHKKNLVPLTTPIIPALHIVLGQCNHILQKFEEIFGSDTVSDVIYETLNIKEKSYWGDNLEGNFLVG